MANEKLDTSNEAVDSLRSKHLDPELKDLEKKESLSQTQLMWRRFLKNKLAIAGGIVLIILYVTMVMFPGFFSTYNFTTQREQHIFAPPQIPRFVDAEGNWSLRPFVYGYNTRLDMARFAWIHEIDTDIKRPIHFFVRGDEYSLLGFFRGNIRLFGVLEGTFFPMGTDRLGRCLYSRIIYGGQISLTVGLIGVALTIVLGSVLGTVSGYYGGLVDNLIQRLVELLMSFPDIPLWAALAAIVPAHWSPLHVFFAISVILSLKNWTGLARQVRAKVLAYREEDYTMAAHAMGAKDSRIILVHMLPNAFSHIIVIATLSIPGMILAETSLSFLGLGIQPPITSWGVLLQASQQVSVVIAQPWLMIPGLFVVLAVLAFNFLGDGIRDAVDPYSR